MIIFSENKDEPLENEWSIASQHGRLRTQKCHDWELCASFLEYLEFLSLIYSEVWVPLVQSHNTRLPIWTHLQHAECDWLVDLLLQVCFKYFAGMCLMRNFSFQIITVCSGLKLRQYLKKRARKLKLLEKSCSLL